MTFFLLIDKSNTAAIANNVKLVGLGNSSVVVVGVYVDVAFR